MRALRRRKSRGSDNCINSACSLSSSAKYTLSWKKREFRISSRVAEFEEEDAEASAEVDGVLADVEVSSSTVNFEESTVMGPCGPRVLIWGTW